MNLYLAYCYLLLLYISTQNCQYNVIRTNPFQHITGTLKTFQGEGCDGGVLGLSCPDGTKVCSFSTTPFFYSFITDIHCLCNLWERCRWVPTMFSVCQPDRRQGNLLNAILPYSCYAKVPQ